jgi:hypothetical protein
LGDTALICFGGFLLVNGVYAEGVWLREHEGFYWGWFMHLFVLELVAFRCLALYLAWA